LQFNRRGKSQTYLGVQWIPTWEEGYSTGGRHSFFVVNMAPQIAQDWLPSLTFVDQQLSAQSGCAITPCGAAELHASGPNPYSPMIYANGKPIGTIPENSEFYRDFAPGTHRFTVDPYGSPNHVGCIGSRAGHEVAPLCGTARRVGNSPVATEPIVTAGLIPPQSLGGRRSKSTRGSRTATK
jgi:hypothetical protein